MARRPGTDAHRSGTTARRLRPVGPEFLESAPLRLAFAEHMTADPEQVFPRLAEDVAGWSRWFRAVAVARPEDGGKRRTVVLRSGTRFTETIVACDAPERYAYRVDETNAPGPRALLEEWRLAPAATGTRLCWTVAVDAPGPVLLGLRVARPGVVRAFRDAVRRLDRHIAEAPR
ncbi:SRPBCC family protein [Streptomyces sp. URMC 123]|uniref:SRPBCC family protein n=1 Tax=Streptomyces sp. URMC 123 TaxID=3423403 RepID=UPI003F1B646C